MNIAVCIKVAPPTTTPKIKPSADGSGIDTTGIKYEPGPYDLFAVTEGVVLIEQKKAAKVHLFTVASTDVKTDEAVSALRGGAIALGCEDLTVIDDPALAKADALGVAKALAAAIKATPDVGLVLTGKQAIDYDNVAVPAMLAELLGYPLVSFVCALDINGDTFTATRSVGGGVEEVVTGKLPAVITCDKGMVQPRYAKLPQIMAAKKAPVHTKKVADLGLSADDVAPATAYAGYGEPPARPAGRILKGDLPAALDELVALLRNEAKVL